MEHEKNLNPEQLEAITALLERATIKEAAADAGVSRGTIYRWLKLPAFREALKAGESILGVSMPEQLFDAPSCLMQKVAQHVRGVVIKMVGDV